MSYRTGFHSGRLGIGLEIATGMGDGTGKPRYPLDINGDIRLTGAIVDSNGDPIQMMAQQRTFPNVISDENITIGDGTVFGAGTFKLNGLKTYYNEGFVGIGTDTPSAPLQIKGPSDGMLILTSNNNKNSLIYTDNGSGNLQLRPHDSSHDITLCDSGGNVGIGTDNPGTYKLKIVGGDWTALMMNNESTEKSNVYVSGGSSGIAIDLTANQSGNYAIKCMGGTGSGGGQGSVPLFWVGTDGNVGIGTSSPAAYKLNVAGNTNISGDLNCDSFSSLVGMVCYFASVLAPNGWITCSGQFLNKSTYNKLYAVIGNIYGEQSNTFRLPDLRGNFIRCLNTSSSGEDTGRSLSTIQTDSTKSPNSSFTTSVAGSHNHTITVNNGGSHNHTGSTGTAGNHNHTGSIGSGGAHRHAQRFWYNYSGWAYVGWHDPRIVAGSFAIGNWGSTTHTTSNANEGGPAIGHHAHSCTIGNNGDHTHSVTINNAAAHSHTASSTTNGSHTHTILGGDIETRPKNYALLACIKY